MEGMIRYTITFDFKDHVDKGKAIHAIYDVLETHHAAGGEQDRDDYKSKFMVALFHPIIDIRHAFPPDGPDGPHNYVTFMLTVENALTLPDLDTRDDPAIQMVMNGPAQLQIYYDLQKFYNVILTAIISAVGHRFTELPKGSRPWDLPAIRSIKGR